MPKALVPLATGVEEMEAVIIMDVLRRAEWEVVSVGLDDNIITASRGVRLAPDTEWASVNPEDFDWIILPGGMPGTEALMADQRVLDALRRHIDAGRPCAAICAAPLVLQSAGVLNGRTYTSHPSVADRLTEGQRSDERVVRDQRLITSQGPGTCFAFALAIVEQEAGPEKAAQLAAAMVLDT